MDRKRPQLLAESVIEHQLRQSLEHWSIDNDHLVRHFKTGGWRATLMIVNTIGHLAEVAWHHPDLVVGYAGVTVKLQTHEAGGITGRDIELANEIERVICWRPGEHDGALTGLPADNPALSYLVHD